MKPQPDIGSRLGQLTRGTDLGWVADVLLRQRDAILKGWLDAAVKQPFHEQRPEDAVADHMPLLFDALLDVLRRSAPRWVDIPPPLNDSHVLAAASDHARVRFEQGLHPDDVVTEFRLLRHEIGHALRTNLADTAPASDVIGAELIVHDALDGAIGLALAHLSRHITQVRDEFLATTAHDVQQPLTGIKGSIQMSRRQLRQDSHDLVKVDNLLAHAETEVDRLATLVRTLADASRLALGRLELQLTTVDVSDLVEEIVTRFIRENGERIALDIRGEDFVGDWDPLALDRVISNLLTNALKYSQADARVRVVLEGRRAFVQISIQDNGIGLEPEELAELFKRYSRSRGAIERHIQGMGLGLYLSKALVAALGGDIWAESPGRDRGSIFYVRLPRQRVVPSVGESI